MIEILSPTPLLTVQDLGREGYRRFGVGASGAMDRAALTVGNLLLGNGPDLAGLEIPMFPFSARFGCDISFAVTGADAQAMLDSAPLPPWWATRAKKGQVLTLSSPLSGMNAYLTVEGGFDVPMVLGSRSTHLRGEFGGFHGRTLKKGDVLAVGPSRSSGAFPTGGFGVEPPQFALPLGDSVTSNVTFIRVMPAAEYDRFSAETQARLWSTDWKISPQSSRAGYRLVGPNLLLESQIEMRSHGLVSGVIQVPAGGQPIIQLADAYTAGGYPKIGTVIEADLWRIGQARLGSALRFIKVDYAGGVSALDALQTYLGEVRASADLMRASAV
jgi:biotin-dependent carboxylase-like uncharacterized protein